MNEVGMLRLLRVRGPMSRRELANALDLNTKTLTNVSRDLLKRGFVESAGIRSAGRGRPNELLKICGTRLQAVGLHVEEHQLTGALISLDGQIIQRRRVALSLRDSSSRLVAKVRDIIRALVRSARVPVLGTGLAFPGILDYSSRTVVACAHLPQWKGVHLDDLGAAPLSAMSYTGAKALAEHWYGAARDADDFLLVDAGEGIGCALVNGGQIDTRRRYIGGELGHTVLNPKGDLCDCGRRGCLETVASLGAILKRSGGAPAVSGAGSPLLVLRRRLSSGDRATVQAVKDAGRALGLALANQVNVLSPARIVMTGETFELSGEFMAAIQMALAAFILPAYYKDLKVMPSQLGRDASLLGAAVLILQATFDA